MNTYKFKIYGHEFETRVIRRDEDEVVISVNGQEYKAYLEPTKRMMQAKPTPKLTRPTVTPAEGLKKTAAPSESKGAGAIKAPLPGLILKVMVKEGDTVKVGDTVLVMEAMKMENSVAAPIAGVVSKIAVTEGQSVLESAELVLIDPA
jgi:glutaconyl-CoA/methylmalonyl-CoA decarboxylase subunit gamma